MAIDRRVLESERAVPVTTDRGPSLIVLWKPGTVSALDGQHIADGLAVGAVGVFLAELDGEPLTFTTDRPAGDEPTVVDEQTGSTWNVSGVATSGPLAGRRLVPLPHLDTFWFAWSRYHPSTALINR